MNTSHNTKRSTGHSNPGNINTVHADTGNAVSSRSSLTKRASRLTVAATIALVGAGALPSAASAQLGGKGGLDLKTEIAT